jgi:hypothetical protein
MVYFTKVDYRDRKKCTEILAKQFAHLVATIPTIWFAIWMLEVIDDPSVNSGPVMQEGSMEYKGPGEFLLRLQAGQDRSNNSNNSKDNNKPVFHPPIKERQIAPLLITTTDIATKQTPAAATILAARTETQNAATAAQGVAAATTERPIAATAAQASTAEGTPQFMDLSMPSPRAHRNALLSHL